MVVSVSPSTSATIPRIPETQHGGGVKKVIAVVAAVVIPIAAPAIASSIAASGVLGAAVSAAASTTVGAVAGSAIVGAGLGAITAKVTGGDVRAGAITGALGGAIGGYGVAQSTGAGLGNVNQTGIQATANRTLGTNFGQPDPAVTASTTSPTAAEPALGAGDAGSTLSSVSGETLTTTPEATLQNAVYTPGTDAASTALSSTTTAPVTSASASGVQTVAQVTGDAAVDAATKASLGERFVAGMKTAGSAVVNKLTDPEALANLTMQAGAQLVGAALAPDPDMPPEQRELLELRKAELTELKNRDEAAFNAQMDAAKQFLQQARQFDPTYMAFQAANKSAIEQQRKLREQQRKYALSRGRGISESERRRMSLDAARNVSSEYDKGFQQGLTGQNKITQAGLSAIPNSAQFATYTDALNNLTDDARQVETTMYAQDRGKNIADLFAGFNIDRGDIDKVREQQQRRRAGVTPPEDNQFGTIAV